MRESQNWHLSPERKKHPRLVRFFLTGAGAHERSDSSSQSHPGLAGSRHTKACLSHPSAGSRDPGQGLNMAADGLRLLIRPFTGMGLNEALGSPAAKDV